MKDPNVIQVGDIVLVKEENTKRGLWNWLKLNNYFRVKMDR